MARIVPTDDGYAIAPTSASEHQLVSDGARRDGQLVIDDAYYVVRSGLILPPSGIDLAGAQRLCASFEQAARSDERARERRRHFRVIDD